VKLSAKFNLVLISVFVAGLALTAFLSYRILQENARREIVGQAGLMMEAALAMRGYTVGEIRPLLAPHMQTEFLPQTVPAYAATQAFSQLRKHHGEYTYKEATLNPTNPRDRAVYWETDIISTFRNHSEREEIIGERDTPTGRSLYLARPIKIKNPACLTCHSTPAAAPKPMLARYGDSNGFGWKLNEVVGAQVVSVPMSVPIEQANRAFFTFMGTLSAVFVVIVVILNIMLRRIVITPVTRMAELADLVSTGKADAPAFESNGDDEIATLATSFTRMRRSLEKAMNMLSG
jgi:protein-histidine pros-kinase